MILERGHGTAHVVSFMVLEANAIASLKLNILDEAFQLVQRI
jgi:hypothetical protein